MTEDKRTIFLGQTAQHFSDELCSGAFVEINKEHFYKISNFDRIPPFFMSVVSDSDHWMFISSSGGLTCGRVNPEFSIFPYYTVDKIHDSGATTGVKNIFLVEKEGKTFSWEPFNPDSTVYSITRNLYKNLLGNKLIFEESNADLGLTYRYSWMNSDRFGFVKKSELINHGKDSLSIRILDGFQNLMAAGISSEFQCKTSCLGDAYKWSELSSQAQVGMFTLAAKIWDRAEPKENLFANVVWQTGLLKPTILLSPRQLSAFKKGMKTTDETLIRGQRCAYFAVDQVEVKPDNPLLWYFVADSNLSQSRIDGLIGTIASSKNLVCELESSIAEGSLNLAQIISNADGFQLSADENVTSHHYANVLFNVMRGGIYDNDYQIQRSDFIHFVNTWNFALGTKHKTYLESFSEYLTYEELLNKIAAASDHNLVRLAYEYLPITFSRRHGDPSRPWNRFSIVLKDKNGHKLLNYQGNWRDIFQNWEALSFSFPGYIEVIISKFVNASTPDGYNPYRITKEGFDWEIVDDDDPWSFIGYWGDHQVIYLLKLLELSSNFHPGLLQKLLHTSIFAYANVPYEIKPYDQITKNPKDTVSFNWDKENSIKEKILSFGMDAKLLLDENDNVVLVNLCEKILISLLAKMSNFVLDGGIWLNTQRPEWNDANNALVGNGVSMVTLYYMRRFLHFLLGLFRTSDEQPFEISNEVADLFRQIGSILDKNQSALSHAITPTLRRALLDQLGIVASNYRQNVYSRGFSGKKTVSRDEILYFFETSEKYIDAAIDHNRRADGLYHAYNILLLNDKDSAGLEHLYEMLEGQVACLSSGKLSVTEAQTLLEKLFASSMYWDRQKSFLLYPDRKLPGFLEKNRIPENKAQASQLLQKLARSGLNQIAVKNSQGIWRFAAELSNALDLAQALNKLEKNPEYAALVAAERPAILSLYEDVFHHKTFTGRSGSMFGFEGLGCIYWHMVSKLLLATQEYFFRALDEKVPAVQLKSLADRYHEIRKGLSFQKTPDIYGAFPMDPYSHTPSHSGAQQPGMTGQVKEEILTRFGELGLRIQNGSVQFAPLLLDSSEFLTCSAEFTFLGLGGKVQTVNLDAGQLAYTYCQVPIIYRLGSETSVSIAGKSGSKKIGELSLDSVVSASLFARDGSINRIDVTFPKNLLLR